MKLTSKAFKHNERIPEKYTGEGKDVSPPLDFGNVPKSAVSLALIVDDPDAPMGTFDHWIVWNLDPASSSLEEGADVPVEGKNHFGEENYRGPLPPPGPVHRYFFKAFALDTKLDLPVGSTKEEVEAAIEGHVLDQAELIGTYQR